MPSDDDFLQAIIDNPDDDLPRLVYADRLEENGEQDRADFIRVQLELARVEDGVQPPPHLLERQRQLLERHQDAWLQPLYDALDPPLSRAGRLRRFARRLLGQDGFPFRVERLREDARFHRGFLEEMSLRGEDFPACAERTFAAAPLLRDLSLWLGGAEMELPPVLQSPLLRRLRALRVFSGLLTDHEVGLLTACKQFAGMKSLTLVADLDGTAVRLLAGSALLSHLSELCLLTSSAFRTGGAEGLVGDEAAFALARSPGCRGLRRLNLSWNPVGDEGARALAGSPHLADLKWLGLLKCRVTAAGVEALLASPHLRSLRRVSVGYGTIAEGDHGALRARFGDRVHL
jgi:uncharacterized protein (TIGR02996 family)